MCTVTNVHLDIDSVLLDGDHSAAGANKFIECVTAHFPDITYWLSGRVLRRRRYDPSSTRRRTRPLEGSG